MGAAHRTVTAVWLILCLVTALSVSLGGGSPETAGGAGLAVAVLGAAFAKVYLVMHYFMELGEAPRPWRAVFIAWCVGVFLILAGILFVL